jgi:hypothetical protein
MHATTRNRVNVSRRGCSPGPAGAGCVSVDIERPPRAKRTRGPDSLAAGRRISMRDSNR